MIYETDFEILMKFLCFLHKKEQMANLSLAEANKLIGEFLEISDE